jgi:hypothetical protein
MNHRHSERIPIPSSKKFVPALRALESRLLLSQLVSFPDGTRVVFPLVGFVPRAGGVAFQSGAALTLGVGQPSTNTAHFAFGAASAATVEFNGGPSRSFRRVHSVLVQAGRAEQDHVTFSLDPSPAKAASAHGRTDAYGTSATTRSVRGVRALRTGVSAVQSGSLLTITVSTRRINMVKLSSLNFGQVVEAEWHGHAMDSFRNVSTIVVDIKNDVKDLVALDVGTAIGP